MERLDVIIKGDIVVGGALWVWLYGEWTPFMGLLILLVIADYVSGFGAASIKH